MARKFLIYVFCAIAALPAAAGCSAKSAADVCGNRKYYISYETGSGTRGSGTKNELAVTERGDKDYSARVLYPNPLVFITEVWAGHDSKRLVSYGGFQVQDKIREVRVPAIQGTLPEGVRPGEKPGTSNQVFYVCADSSKPESPQPQAPNRRPTASTISLRATGSIFSLQREWGPRPKLSMHTQESRS